MKTLLVFVAALLLLQGSWAQEACDPATSGTALIDLSDKIGALGCKVPPSVDLAAVMGKLTGTLKNFNNEQLQQLPGLLQLLGGNDPAVFAPFLALSSDELSKTIPLLTDVPVSTLRVALPLLAKQDISVIQKMIKFLKLVSGEKLQQMTPLFSRLTQCQANVMLHALNTLPDAMIDKMINIVQALGPVTDAGVAAKQKLGLFPSIRVNTGKQFNCDAGKPAGSADGGSNGGSSKGVSLAPHLFFSTAPATSSKVVSFKLGGRKLAQACDPTQRGLEIGVTLLGDFGPVVCKFGPDTLKPVLTQIIDGLLQQTPEQLARLPQLADTMANLDPNALSAISSIPQSTLRELLPVLSGIDSSKLTAQLKLLGQQDRETISKMTNFLKAAPIDKMELLIGVFAALTENQIHQLAKLVNALSPGQIFLTIHLLDTFGFAVDAIGAAVPPPSGRSGKGFMIGPVMVRYE